MPGGGPRGAMCGGGGGMPWSMLAGGMGGPPIGPPAGGACCRCCAANCCWNCKRSASNAACLCWNGESVPVGAAAAPIKSWGRTKLERLGG
jgi:hypothetical protein